MDLYSLQIDLVLQDTYDLATAKSKILEDDARIQYDLLKGTDWAVVRFTETTEAIPSDITTYRTNVRTAGNSRKSKINACSSLDDLKALLMLPSTNPGEDGLPVADENALPEWPLSTLFN